MQTTIPVPASWIQIIAQLKLPHQCATRLQHLMDRNNEAQLTVSERAELEWLVELSEELSLVRAQAQQLLTSNANPWMPLNLPVDIELSKGIAEEPEFNIEES